MGRPRRRRAWAPRSLAGAEGADEEDSETLTKEKTIPTVEPWAVVETAHRRILQAPLLAD